VNALRIFWANAVTPAFLLPLWEKVSRKARRMRGFCRRN
jgi:hypothetical protein